MPIDPGSLWSASCSSRGGQLQRAATTDGNAGALFGASDELVEGVRVLFADRVLELAKSVDRQPALGVLDDLELVLLIAERKGVNAPGLGADDDRDPLRSLALDDEQELVLAAGAGHLADDLLRARAEKEDLGDDDDERLSR